MKYLLILVLLCGCSCSLKVDSKPTPRPACYRVTHYRSNHQCETYLTPSIIPSHSSVKVLIKNGTWKTLYGDISIEELPEIKAE